MEEVSERHTLEDMDSLAMTAGGSFVRAGNVAASLISLHSDSQKFLQALKSRELVYATNGEKGWKSNEFPL